MNQIDTVGFFSTRGRKSDSLHYGEVRRINFVPSYHVVPHCVAEAIQVSSYGRNSIKKLKSAGASTEAPITANRSKGRDAKPRGYSARNRAMPVGPSNGHKGEAPMRVTLRLQRSRKNKRGVFKVRYEINLGIELRRRAQREKTRHTERQTARLYLLAAKATLAAEGLRLLFP